VVTSTLTITSSNLLIVSDPSLPKPLISGGYHLPKLTWEPVTTTPNLYSTPLPTSSPIFQSLFTPTNTRAIRARYPNADPERSDMGNSGICIQSSTDGYKVSLTQSSLALRKTSTLAMDFAKLLQTQTYIHNCYIHYYTKLTHSFRSARSTSNLAQIKNAPRFARRTVRWLGSLGRCKLGGFCAHQQPT